MLRDDVLQLTQLREPDVDFKTAAKHITALRGRVCVEMLPFEGSRGTILLPDNVAADLRPDVGVVLSAGKGVLLEPGDVVIVRPYDGTRRINFKTGQYVAEGEIRMYGVYCPPGAWGDQISLYEYWDSVVATLKPNMDIRPTGKNILVKRDPIIEQDGMLYLPDRSIHRTNFGTVIAAGPQCEELEVGDRVVYHPQSSLTVEIIDGDPDLAIMREDSIEVKVA